MDGWDYGPGADSGWNFSGSSGGSDAFWGGLGNAVGGLVNTAANTWSQKTLMQAAQNGQLQYIEGQAAANWARQQQATGGISPLLLLIGVGLVVALMMKN